MNVEEILQQNNIQYEDKGEAVKVLCPFHADHHPSASIYKESGSFKCFACKKGPLPFHEYIKQVTGNELDYKPQYTIYESKKKNQSLKQADYTIDGELFNIFDNQFVREYCWSIGLTDEFIEQFDVKYFKKATFDDPRIQDKTKIKSFYNRIIIPCVFEGKILNYECRDFTRRSPVKVLYPLMAENDFFFNWDNINLDEEVFVVEGIKGLSHPWSYYSHNIVSSFGKMLKDNQKKLLCKAKKVCRIVDNDENKINIKTGRPVDNILECIEEMDEFYPYEYTIAYPPFVGTDTANLNRVQIRNMIQNKKTASDILIERSGFFKKENTFSFFE